MQTLGELSQRRGQRCGTGQLPERLSVGEASVFCIKSLNSSKFILRNSPQSHFYYSQRVSEWLAGGQNGGGESVLGRVNGGHGASKQSSGRQKYGCRGRALTLVPEWRVSTTKTGKRDGGTDVLFAGANLKSRPFVLIPGPKTGGWAPQSTPEHASPEIKTPTSTSHCCKTYIRIISSRFVPETWVQFETGFKARRLVTISLPIYPITTMPI